VGETSEIRELIRAAAEGATGGVAALRAAGIPAALGGFAVEIDFAGGNGHGAELGAVVRLSLIVAEEGSAGGSQVSRFPPPAPSAPPAHRPGGEQPGAQGPCPEHGIGHPDVGDQALGE
jgi:hypothetical protein